MGAAPRRTLPVSFYGMGVYRLFWAAVLLACLPTVTKAAENLLGCATSYDPALDYFPQKFLTGDDWVISYHLNYKVVYNPYSNETIVLTQCGTPAPTSYPHAKHYDVPVTKVGAGQTQELPFLEAIGKRSSIKIVASETYITSPCINKMIDDSMIEIASANETVLEEQLKSVDVYFNGYGTNPKYVAFSATEAHGSDNVRCCFFWQGLVAR